MRYDMPRRRARLITPAGAGLGVAHTGDRSDEFGMRTNRASYADTTRPAERVYRTGARPLHARIHRGQIA